MPPIVLRKPQLCVVDLRYALTAGTEGFIEGISTPLLNPTRVPHDAHSLASYIRVLSLTALNSNTTMDSFSFTIPKDSVPTTQENPQGGAGGYCVVA